MANKHLGLDTRGGLYEETGTILLASVVKIQNGPQLLVYLLLESTNTAPSNLKYNISMNCTVFTYHLS